MVNIPVKIYSATKANDLSFHLLHREDMGRISNERVCRKCNRNLEYDELVHGYEYEKGKYVALSEEDLANAEVESSKSMTIMDFVDPDDIDPMYFDKPYYLAPDDNSEKLYVLLREALKRTNRVAIVKFVMRDREYLAAIKQSGQALMLDTMHFADELRQPKGIGIPSKNVSVGERELDMAQRLIDTMSGNFDPEKYKNVYRENLLEIIEKKLEGKQVRAARPKQEPEPTNIVDILSKLKASLEKTGGKKKKKSAAA